MKKKTKDPDWIILVASKGGRFQCLRCGVSHVPFPEDGKGIEIRALTSLIHGFQEMHSVCKEKPEGLHCGHCNELGHAPATCPKLQPSTPEEWIEGPDTGTSSRVIFAVMYGFFTDGVRRTPLQGLWNGDNRLDGRGSTPLDPSDFGGCSRLLKLFGWRPRLGEVATAFPAWARLVEHWDELEALYQEELPSGSCPKLYARLQDLQ